MPVPADDATDEQVGDSFGGFSFMFNEGVKILVSNSTASWEESRVELYEELTLDKQGQIYVAP